ncbi:metallopeptidase family protein [Nocardia heshunensis]
MPVTMADARFEELVADALDRIPSEFSQAIRNVVVLIEPSDPEDPDVLGVYHGVPPSDPDYFGDAGRLPDTITIYRDTILEICDSEEEVVEEVTITVVHEIAHYFGIDDERLHQLGWG